MRKALSEIGKTIVWLPWAILELLRGDLGPDAKSLLCFGVFMTLMMLAYVAILSAATYAISDIPPFPHSLTVGAGIYVYMVLGAAVRYVGRHLWILR